MKTREAIHATMVYADEPFEWWQATDRAVRFDHFAHLIQSAPEFSLSRVRVIHSHFDWIIPDTEQAVGSHTYRTLTRHIQKTTGKQPSVVRTRHDDLQGALDRLMRLTGIDFFRVAPQERATLLDGGRDLQSRVQNHVRRNREQLLEQGFSEELLENAIDHVWYVLSQWKRWVREQRDADAIVNLSQAGSRLQRHFNPAGKNNLTYVHNGTSMVQCDWQGVDELVRGYHSDATLQCYRGDAEETTGIQFAPSDHKVLYVGRDDRGKGIDEFVQAMCRLYHARPWRRPRAIIVGEFSSDRRKELCRLDPEHASRYLLFTGWVDDAERMLSILAFGNVTAIPSHCDSFNLAACESYLAATPCVITEDIGAAEIYLDQPRHHGVQIALPIRRRFESGVHRFYGVDIDSLESQIARLLDDDALAYRLGRDGRDFVKEHYDYRVMGKRYSDLYRVLMRRSA